jgi:hypothetical protein
MSGLERVAPVGALALLASTASAGQVTLGTLLGSATGDGFGKQVKYADVDGDGDQDIVVAALRADNNNGTLYVFDDAISGPMSTPISGADGFGHALDLGNLNSTAGAEIVVGSPLASGGIGTSLAAG